MTVGEILELLDEEAVLFDDIEGALIGVADRFGMPTVACYDKNKALQILADSFMITIDDIDENEIEEGVTIENKRYEMALEWFDYNTIGAWVGDHTPVFITLNTD